jgi:hypothetical protein
MDEWWTKSQSDRRGRRKVASVICPALSSSFPLPPGPIVQTRLDEACGYGQAPLLGLGYGVPPPLLCVTAHSLAPCCCLSCRCSIAEALRSDPGTSESGREILTHFDAGTSFLMRSFLKIGRWCGCVVNAEWLRWCRSSLGPFWGAHRSFDDMTKVSLI